MQRNYGFLVGAACLTMAGGATIALAQETTTYTYDGLGRLKASTIAGGPNDTRKTATCFDAAGNRKQYKVANGTPPACGTPPSSAPVALNPSFAMTTGTTKGIALADLATTSGAAAIITFAPPAGGGSATIAADKQSVLYVAPSLERPGLCEPAYTNFYSVPYSVQNTPGGASANGTASFAVKSLAGPRPQPGQACP